MKGTAQPSLYSIGYATKPINQFIEQLKQNRIDAVADVRSVPYSKAFHDYHRETLAKTLKNHAIYYVYLGDELGPRSKDDAHYDDHGQVQFDRLMTSALYQQGVQRLRTGLDKGLNIALMCAEKDPADCHRSLLIGYEFLHRQGIGIWHIDHEGRLETQQVLEERLVAIHGMENSLFAAQENSQKLAYGAQVRDKAYRRSDSEG